jgi:hypothetical protein
MFQTLVAGNCATSREFQGKTEYVLFLYEVAGIQYGWHPGWKSSGNFVCLFVPVSPQQDACNLSVE